MPASPWLGAVPPDAPRLSVTRRGDAADVIALPGGATSVHQWVVRARRGGAWTWTVIPADSGTYVLPAAGGRVEAVAVSGVDRVGNEGPARMVEVGHSAE